MKNTKYHTVPKSNRKSHRDLFLVKKSYCNWYLAYVYFFTRNKCLWKRCRKRQNRYQEEKIITLPDYFPPHLGRVFFCFLFFICSYLYCCCGHPISKRNLLSHYQITSRHVCVVFFIIHIYIAGNVAFHFQEEKIIITLPD